MLAASDEGTKGRCKETYRKEKIRVKRCIIQSKKEINDIFGRKMNEDNNGNRKLLWKEVSKANGGKVANYIRIKDGNGRLGLEEVEVRRIWKEYFEELYNIDTQEQFAIHMCGFDGIQRGNYFGGYEN